MPATITAQASIASGTIKVDSGAVQEVPLDRIQPGNNDRTAFEQVALQELADSLSAHGLAQPITVRPLPTGNYEIVAGERRFRAAQLLEWATIPALVRALDDETAASIMLVENLMRADLNPIDEARAYQKRMDQFGWTVTEVAKKAEVNAARVRSRLDLLSLVWEAQELVKFGHLALAYAEVMMGLDANHQMLALRYFQQARRPTLTEYRQLCQKLLGSQMQESLFDLSAFEGSYQAQQDLQAMRNKKYKATFPTHPKLPDMKGATTVGKALEAYMGTLLASKDPEVRAAALVVGSVFEGLVNAKLARPPMSVERMMGVEK